MRRLISLFFLIWGSCSVTAQSLDVLSKYLRLDARPDDPLYTTYAAAMSRSRLYGDKAYKMDYYSGCRPVTYSSDQAGSMFCIWKVDGVVILNTGEFLSRPVVEYSFPDMAILDYEPFRGISVKETFLVYSSMSAIVDMEITNTDKVPHEVAVYPVLYFDKDSLLIRGFDSLHGGYVLQHYESPYRLISSLKTEYGYPTRIRDLFISGSPPYSYGGYTGDMNDFYNSIKTDFYSDKRTDTLDRLKEGFVRFAALHLKKRLRPGETVNFRYIRGAQSQLESLDSLTRETDALRTLFLKTFYEDNLMLFSRIPRITFKDKDEKLIYIGAFNLARGCMYPPSGKTRYNFYAFSRNPLWGWGHGHQVLHESLSMLAYAYL
ncbi:MAG TPA: hypothetical protein VMC08_03850, partial [Bacteroidales bacterium]|nr:hypothetical protein [Bacteroidales bacterium]